MTLHITRSMNQQQQESAREEETREQLKLTEEHAVALMDILLTRGYFHPNGASSSPPLTWKDDPIVPAADNDPNDRSCRVISTVQGTYATVEYLQEKLMEYMQTTKSCTTTEAAATLDVNVDDLSSRILTVELLSSKKYAHDNLILLPKNRIMTQQYVEEASNQSVSQLGKEGCLFVSSLAQTHDWTIDDCRRFLSPRLAEKEIQERRNDKGMFVFVTAAYQEQLETRVQGILSQSSEIIHLGDLCRENHWETSWVTDIVHRKIDELPGIIRGEDFVPDEYRKGQERIALDHYSTNGYVTTSICTLADLLPNQLKSLLKSKLPDCIVLNDCIIDYAAVGVPLEALLQEATSSFAELRLPPDLLNFTSDVRNFVQNYVLPNCDDATGTLTVTAERVLFVSKSMVGDIQNNILPLLVNAVVNERAVEIVKNMSGGQHIDEVDWDNHVDFVSTESVTEALIEMYPALQVLPPDGEDDILEAFVDMHLLNEAWRDACRRALQVEVTRLETARAKQTGIISHTSAAEVAFEDPSCFAAACIVIQMQAKFLEYTEKIGMAESDRARLRKEVLEGCCRDFVRRLMLYLLDKYKVEDSVVTFETDGKGTPPSSYCTPVDTTIRRYPALTISCALDCNGKARPLAEALTDSVPLEAGKALAELGDASSVEEFLQIAEENCLSICGIPFRKIDKKSEKTFLAQRRQRLVELLQKAKDPRDVLELTIMLIYQGIKNQAVSGSLLPGPILDRLTLERKVSTPVSEALKCLAHSLLDSSCDDALVERVRRCGLAKDISKHVIA